MQNRISSIDFVRGLVMLLMALDHIRDMYHASSLTMDPTDLSVTTPYLFFTRWITHLCAPTFVFLAGLSAYLSFRKRKSLSQSRKFLLTRGIWLIFLEFTVINFGIWFDIHFNVFLFQVIAALGFGFIFLGTLLSLDARVIGILGLCYIVFQQILPPMSIPLAGPGLISLGSRFLVIGYPPLPWMAILFIGFGFGPILLRGMDRRSVIFLGFGLGCLLLFVLLRLGNAYGEPTLWQMQQKGWIYSLMSFVNVTKYPPSLLYCLLLLGLMFLLLSLAEGMKGTVLKIGTSYGTVSLFYYLIHWYIIHSLLFVLLWAQGFGTADFRFGFNFGRPESPSGLSLWGVYVLWIAVICLLYPVCRWYAVYKRQHPEKAWLQYL